MAIAFVNVSTNSGFGSGPTVSTAAANHITGNLIVVGVSQQGGTISSVTDTAGNTYTEIGSAETACSVNNEHLFYAYNITGHGSNVVSVNFSSGGSFVSVLARQFSGFTTADPLDGTAQADAVLDSNVDSGTVAVTGPEAVIVGMIVHTGNLTPGTGYTATTVNTNYSSVYHIVTASENVTGTISDSSCWGVKAAAFKAEAVGIVTSTKQDGDLSNPCTTGAIDTTGADLIVMVGAFTITPGSFSDSEGNTWTQVASTGGNAQHRMVYCLSPSTSATHTFTVTGFAPSLCVAAFSGVLAYDSNATNTNTTGTSITTSAITPATANSLFVSGFAVNNNTNNEDATPTAPYTKLQNAPAQSGSNVGSAISYYIQSGSSADDDTTWSVPGSADLSASLMSFEITAGGGGVVALSFGYIIL